jgi:hypothetical protein
MGWFHVANAPPIDDAKILSNGVKASFSRLPFTFRIVVSASLARPMLSAATLTSVQKRVECGGRLTETPN